MLFLVKLFPEITIKSRAVRRRLVRLLRKNIRSVLQAFEDQLRVSGEWDVIEVEIDSSTDGPEVLDKLRHIPGIASILEVRKYPLPDFEGMLSRPSSAPDSSGLRSLPESIWARRKCWFRSKSGMRSFMSCCIGARDSADFPWADRVRHCR